MAGEVIRLTGAALGVPFAVALVAFIVVIYGVYYVSKFTTKTKDGFCSIKSTLADMSARMDKTNEEWNKRFEQEHDEREKQAAEFRENIKGLWRETAEVKMKLGTISGQLGVLIKKNALTESNSPISLTELGKKAAEDLQAREMIDKNWLNIFAMLASANVTSAYDVQEFCINQMQMTPEKFIGEDGIKRVKAYAYKNGYAVELYYRVFSVIMRDRYLKEAGITE